MTGTGNGLDRQARLEPEAAFALIEVDPLDPLLAASAALRDEGFGDLISYSRKVFIPLTQLCRDSCHYCTFAHPPRKGEPAYLPREAILDIARKGAAAGCNEALFTLGDKPERRYRVAQDELTALGHASTLSYLAEVADLVFRETGLLPHVNPGVMTRDDIAALRRVSVSQGLMLESGSRRLCAKGGPHYGSPDKEPSLRLRTIAEAGSLRVPFTTGILIGIGETRRERIEAMLALRALQDRYGHIQEIIIQNFRAKPGTKMANAPEPDLRELLWTIAVARMIFGPAMSIQAPPNLSPDAMADLVRAGLNDWGGVSPVTLDFVNPEAPWPHLETLSEQTARAGKVLEERLAIYPGYARDCETWTDPAFHSAVRRSIDTEGLVAREAWRPGCGGPLPADAARIGKTHTTSLGRDGLEGVFARAFAGERLSEAEIVRLFQARAEAFSAVCSAADRLRRRVKGETVTYVVNRNINYTNICTYRCGFCAFSKGKTAETLRDKPYNLDLDEIARRAVEARSRGATEVCLQGGIHPHYSGETYLAICRAVKKAAPGLHIHAFSPLEIWHGATTLGLTIDDFLRELKSAGLRSLPGTAAEILDDEVRAQICADKITSEQWLDVIEAAHIQGLPTTSTIMFGHVDGPLHWARHLLRLRDLQERTGGLTEFVPLPFVHMEAPLYLKGRARKGPTFRESMLMHAVARLVLHPLVGNIQASWVKLGSQGAAASLQAGVNDLGGTLMDESISRAAGARHGQGMTSVAFETLIRDAGRTPRQRTTLYEHVAAAPTGAAVAQAAFGNITGTTQQSRVAQSRAAQRAPSTA
jgi:FO synthase